MNLRYGWSHPTCREKGENVMKYVCPHSSFNDAKKVGFVGSTPEDSDERRGETKINWVWGVLDLF